MTRGFSVGSHEIWTRPALSSPPLPQPKLAHLIDLLHAPGVSSDTIVP